MGDMPTTISLAAGEGAALTGIATGAAAYLDSFPTTKAALLGLLGFCGYLGYTAYKTP